MEKLIRIAKPISIWFNSGAFLSLEDGVRRLVFGRPSWCVDHKAGYLTKENYETLMKVQGGGSHDGQCLVKFTTVPMAIKRDWEDYSALIVAISGETSFTKTGFFYDIKLASLRTLVTVLNLIDPRVLAFHVRNLWN